MFKSASTSQFQNTAFNATTYPTFNPYTYEIKSPVLTRPKKLGVKFEIENQKENSKTNIDIFDTPICQRMDKHTRTWTHHRIASEIQTLEARNALKQSKHCLNLYKDLGDKIQRSRSKSKQRFCKTDTFGFTSRKCIQFEDKKHLDIPSKFTRPYDNCKSMKIIPSYNPDEQIQISSNQTKKSERKYKQNKAFNELLKQSQNLVQKFKKLQDQKSRLKSDLKSQIESRSKSTKKIVFLEETEAAKNLEKVEQRQDNSQKYKDYGMSSQKLKSYQKYQSPRYDSKYQLTTSKLTFEDSMNNTFSSSSNKSYSTEDSSFFKPDSNSLSYSGSFGLSKSSSMKKLSPTGLSLADFQLSKCLGSGAFGQVFPATHKKTGWIFALKKVKKESVKHMLDQFIQEIKIQLFLDHPNIVKLYSFFNDELHFYILMEYMQGGSLYSYLKKKKTLTLQETSLKLSEVCQGLQYMHENQILHRDIKPENIVLSHNVSKLCDFGWSAICKDRRTTYCGTLDYVCPEIIEGEGYDDSVDVWCVGVLAYELLVGKTPFYNISRKQTTKKIRQCDLECPSTMPEIAVKFVKNILKKNPDHRQTIQQILKDPFLKISQNTNSSL